jgi:hypothetical protein
MARCLQLAERAMSVLLISVAELAVKGTSLPGGAFVSNQGTAGSQRVLIETHQIASIRLKGIHGLRLFRCGCAEALAEFRVHQ